MNDGEIRLRALERTDLRFIHQLNNNRIIMAYWFEEPYESFDELEELYNKHIHDKTERRFIAENAQQQTIGLVELVEINDIHRNAEFQIIIAPEFQGRGYARAMVNKALNYAFTILNLYKVYLHVALENDKALQLYQKCGFKEEGHLVQESFINGQYSDVKRMYVLQADYLQLNKIHP
ncbi:spermidine N1-acetyltransferase [Shewanella algae]|uniref:spermidine N1-acetyltransferase n=1 Tax=Shewanella algae TaxID=38313 RepID=UPI0010211819|nr:spermidine N1-acetyltransferase [Shewanella algae]MBO2677266.1 spermidine N1-acetyltransferase [Shewanella algae]